MTYETPGDGSNYPGFGNSYFKPSKRFNDGMKAIMEQAMIVDAFICRNCENITMIERKANEPRPITSDCKCGCKNGLVFYYTRELP